MQIPPDPLTRTSCGSLDPDGRSLLLGHDDGGVGRHHASRGDRSKLAVSIESGLKPTVLNLPPLMSVLEEAPEGESLFVQETRVFSLR